MEKSLKERVKALREALDNEVHGLWISEEMAIRVLRAVDAVANTHPPYEAGALPQ